MPLVRFEVRNEVGLGDPGLYGGGAAAAAASGATGVASVAGNKGAAAAAAAGEEEPKALLEGVAVAGLVGILRQLGDLAEFAADVFHDLHEQVIATSARGRKVLTRVQNIEAALPSLEKAVKNQKSHIHFAYVPGSDWHTQLQNEQNHLLASDLPRFMMDSYEECRDPPRLYLLDKFDTAGAGACVKRYSDPSYFKKAWDMTRAGKTANLQREKRSQKIKRKGSRLREPYHGQATSRHRGTEFQRSLTAGQLGNRQFASPSNDGQSISEQRSTPDARSNPDNMSRSSSLSSKTQLSSVEQAFDTKPSAVPHENGHGKSLDTKLHKPGGLPSRILLNGTNVDDHSDYLKQGSLPGDMVARSPYVKWDEKAAITMSTSSVYCDDVVMDKAEDAEPICTSSVQKETGDKVMDALEQHALLKKTKSLLVPSVLNHHDDIPGEADNYMDALNTLESETETESEFQTKNQGVPAPSFNAEAPQVRAIDNIVPRRPDSSVTDFADVCQESDILRTSERGTDFPSLSNADSLDVSPLDFSDYTSVSPYKESSVITNIHENGAEGACGDSCEIIEPLQVHSATLSNDGSPVCNEIPKPKPDDDLGYFPDIPQPGFSTCMVIPSNKESDVDNAESVGDLIDGIADNVVSGPNIANMVVDEVGFKMAPADKSSPDDPFDDSCVTPESRPQDYAGKSQEEDGDCGEIGASKLFSEPLNKPSDNICATQDVPTNTSTMSPGASEVSSSWSEPLNEPMANRCATQGVPSNASTTSTVVPSVKLWTNAGLFGLEPSKPPVFGAQDGPREDTPPDFKEAQPVHSTEFTELHCSKPIESAAVDVPNGNTSITSSFVEKLVGIRPGSANSNSSGANQSAARILDPIHSHTDGHSDFSSSFEHNNMTGKHTSISELLESEGTAETGTEVYSTDMRNNMHMVSASSFSSIAQRFLANTLQRRIPSKYTDLPMSSERVDADTSAKDESTLNPVEPSETVFAKETKFENKTENGMDGLTKSSIFPSRHYSEKSSPPLEYMKISFHPMSAFETSKMNLDFCDGNLHEISDDMMLPTFQLLSESSIPQPGSGSESEDDTFGRSYSYSSYDDLSPRLYSNSEVWDQEDAVGLEEHELYDDSNQIESSTAPLSSYMGFEQMNLSGMESDISLANIGDQNVIGTLESCTVEELPNFDTLMSRSDDQNGGSPIPHNPVNLPPDEDQLLPPPPLPQMQVNLPPNEDQLPPPPPLPPMQWRMTRQTTSLEEETCITDKDMLRKTSSLPHIHTSAQEEHLPPTAPLDLQGHVKEVDVQKTGGVREITNPPSIVDIKSSLLQQIRDKSEKLKLNNGHERSKKAVGGDIKSLDEREELLQQIRSKTFNLRPTNSSKTDGSSQSTANSNVVAILEKANAIRQAVASDCGDDDTWSDI